MSPLFQEALTWFKNGYMEQAAEGFYEVLRLEPDNCIARYNYALSLEKLGEIDKSIQEYRAVIHHPRRLAKAYINLGNLLGQLDRRGEAILVYMQGLTDFPNSTTLHYNYAIDLTKIGQTDGAIQEYRKAIELDDTMAKAHYNVALLYAEKSQWRLAIASYRKVLSLEPEHPHLHDSLGVALAKSEDADGAIDQFSLYLEKHPHDEQMEANLGRVCLIKAVNDRSLTAAEAAEKHFEAVLSAHPLDFQLWSHLATARKLKKRFAR